MKATVLMALAFPPADPVQEYNKILDLFRSSPNRDLLAERRYNNGYSRENLDFLRYDIKKMHGVTDLDVAICREETGKKSAAKPAGKKQEETSDVVHEESKPEQESPAKPVEEIEVSGPEEFVAAPGELERTRMRDEFPFLKEKDCPSELKVLVADKITAYELYCENQAKLLAHSNGTQVLDKEEFARVTKLAVDASDENRAIYKELEHYKKTGKVLGDHPIFEEYNMRLEVEQMSGEELSKFVNSSAKFKSTKTAQLNKTTDPAKKEVLKAEIEKRERKLKLVKAALSAK